jgi:hypothetical protein
MERSDKSQLVKAGGLPDRVVALEIERGLLWNISEHVC